MCVHVCETSVKMCQAMLARKSFVCVCVFVLHGLDHSWLVVEPNKNGCQTRVSITAEICQQPLHSLQRAFLCVHGSVCVCVSVCVVQKDPSLCQSVFLVHVWA